MFLSMDDTLDLVDMDVKDDTEKSSATVDVLPSDFADVLAQLHGTEPQKIKQAVFEDAFEIGKYYPGEGIYIGEWEPNKDLDIKGTFNLFAAKKDLGKLATYNDTVEQVKAIEDLEGHKGAQFNHYVDLYVALLHNSYKGEWFIPTPDILRGNKVTQQTNLAVTMPKGSLSDLRDVGELKGSFNIRPLNPILPKSLHNYLYWTFKQAFGDIPIKQLAVLMDEGTFSPQSIENKLSCRLVRAKLK